MTHHFAWDAAFLALACMGLAGVVTWLLSLARRNVSIVDSLWAVMITLGTWVYALAAPQIGPRETLVLLLASLWTLRLSGYITWRNWGHGEDRRYQAIRARNQPHFEFKSLYLVFGLQAGLAWIVAWPLMAALAGSQPLGLLDASWTRASGAIAVTPITLASSVSGGASGWWPSPPVAPGPLSRPC